MTTLYLAPTCMRAKRHQESLVCIWSLGYYAIRFVSLNVRLQGQTGRAKVDLAFVQTQPLSPHLTVAEEQNFNAF